MTYAGLNLCWTQAEGESDIIELFQLRHQGPSHLIITFIKNPQTANLRYRAFALRAYIRAADLLPALC